MSTQPNVSEKAILAHLETTFSKFEKTDKRVSSEMATLKGAKDGIFKTHRGLFPECDAPLKAVLAAIENVRTVHERNSVPWAPSRAVRIEHFTKHRDRVKEAINLFDIALQKFHDAYPQLVQQGIANSNGLNNLEEYLPQSEIYSRFTITITYDQLTDANDWFKSPVTAAVQQELAQQTIDSQKRILKGAEDATKDQLVRILLSARDNLQKTETKTEGQRFNTQWLLNLQSFTELWPGLNLSEDPLVDQMILDLQPITKHTQETMKTSRVAQTQASTTLSQFIAKYDSWLNS